MIRLITIFFFRTFLAFSLKGQINPQNDPVKHPRLTNSQTVNELNGKSIIFYLTNSSIDEFSKMFYRGEFAVSDDYKTFAFLDSISTNNSITRPFYFWIFNQVLAISDGAISEMMGGFCLKYLSKFTCEFYGYLDNQDYNVNLQQWSDFIGYEFYASDWQYGGLDSYIQQLKKNCPERTSDLEKLEADVREFIEKNK